MVSTSYGLKPIASVKVEIEGKEYEDRSTGDGQYDAFVKALRTIYKEKLGKTFPKLDNSQVTIPPGGRTDATFRPSSPGVKEIVSGAPEAWMLTRQKQLSRQR